MEEKKYSLAEPCPFHGDKIGFKGSLPKIVLLVKAEIVLNCSFIPGDDEIPYISPHRDE